MVQTEGSAVVAERRELRIGPRELLALVASIMALMAVGIDLMLPAFDEIRDAFDLGDGSNATGQIVTVYFLGTSITQLAFGPIADRYGRKPVLVAAIVIYVAGAAGSALAPTFAVLLVSRFVWGVGAAGARVVALAVVRDRFDGDAMAKAMSQIMAVFVLVPVVAPALGAGIIAISPWRTVFWFCVFWALAIALWSRRLDETLDPAHVQPLSFASSWASYKRVATTPISAGYTIASVFLQAIMTVYLATIELIIGDIYDRESLFPLVFGIVALGFGVGAVVNGRVVERYGIDRMVDYAFMAGLPLAALLVGLSILGDGTPSFWVLVVMLVPTLGSLIFLMPNLNAAAMLPVPDIAGAAAAFIGGFRILLGALIAIVLTTFIDDSVTPFAWFVLVLNVACLVSVWQTRRLQAATAAPTPI